MDNFYRDLKGEPAQGVMDISKTQKYPLGCRFAKNDGRVFRYAKAGAVALVAGDLIQSATLQGALTTVQIDLAVPTTMPADSTTIGVTTLITGQPKNKFRDGFIFITDLDAAGGMGDMYQIKSHAAQAAAGLLTLNLYEPTKREIPAGAACAGLLGNIYKDVIQSPASAATGLAVGVCPTVVTIAYHFWLQTWGLSNVLVGTASLADGCNVIKDEAVAGAVTLEGAGVAGANVGITGCAVTHTDSGPVFLTLAP